MLTHIRIALEAYWMCTELILRAQLMVDTRIWIDRAYVDTLKTGSDAFFVCVSSSIRIVKAL